ncbi:MAG: hypothetical protein GX816_03005 [Erysipelotrichia bacterium]|jgi:hypothetical protein|nr:hypothetical protein [Erysipelotrichia bacterium]
MNMKYNHPETALVTISGPEQTSWVGDVTIEITHEGAVVGIIKGQKSVQFEINQDTRFKARTINTDFPKLEVIVAALFRCPTVIKLYLVGGSKENAKLVAKTTYGANYKSRNAK